MAERALLDLYFEALGRGDPGLLPLAPGARYTENGQEIPFGSGTWATVTEVAAERNISVADHEQRQQAGWGMIAEAGAGALAGVRLKAGTSGLITEAETLIVRSPLFGRADGGGDRDERPGPGAAARVPADRADRDRRYPVIDVERGLVLGLVFFDHPGLVRTASVPPRFAAPNSYFIWELFKVSGGSIRHIEAVMAMFPYGMRPGW